MATDVEKVVPNYLEGSVVIVVVGRVMVAVVRCRWVLQLKSSLGTIQYLMVAIMMLWLYHYYMNELVVIYPETTQRITVR